MRNSLKIVFILLFSVLSFYVYGSLKQISGTTIAISQQEKTNKKEIHSFEHPTTISDNSNRTIQSNVNSLKIKIAKSFYNIHFLKGISKKQENKSILTTKYFSFEFIPIGFKKTDIIFPFHYFW